MSRHRMAQAGFLILGLVIMAWTLLPVLHILVVSLTPLKDTFAGTLWPEHPTLSNYARVLTQEDYYLQNFWRQMGNSLFAAVTSCLLVLAIATSASFAVERLKVRYGVVITNLALLTYLIPAAFLAVPFYQVMGSYGLLDSLWALILSVTTFTAPYGIWVLRQYAESLPVELDEAARIDGASPVQIYRHVYLPLVTPAMVAIGSFAFLHAWNEYLYAFLLLSSETRQTLPVSLGYFIRNDDAVWPMVMAIALIYSVPPVALYFSVRRYMVSGLVAGSVK